MPGETYSTEFPASGGVLAAKMRIYEMLALRSSADSIVYVAIPHNINRC